MKLFGKISLVGLGLLLLVSPACASTQWGETVSSADSVLSSALGIAMLAGLVLAGVLVFLIVRSGSFDGKKVLATIVIIGAVFVSGFLLISVSGAISGEVQKTLGDSEYEGEYIPIYTYEELTSALSRSHSVPLVMMGGIVDAPSTIVIPAGTTNTINLNNTAIQGVDDMGAIFRVQGSLTIVDNSEYQYGKILTPSAGARAMDVYGSLTINSGNINQCGADYGGGVYVRNGASFVMNGGMIMDCTASASGGGVYVATGGTFTMNGGTITSNTASTRGGGVTSDGTFTRNGGEITGNTPNNVG